MMKILKELCGAGGISGDEGKVRDIILSRIGGKAEYRVDSLGNVLAFKKGAKRPPKRVMFCAHMDEVGLIVTYIEDSGVLRFDAVGGIDPRVLPGAKVKVGAGGIDGVIGQKPVHLLKDEEKGAAPDIEQLYIDIGAKDKAGAEKYVKPGDSVVFEGGAELFGDGLIKGKALDDRAGCALLLDLMTADLPFDAYFAFTVQEEVGTRGAKAAAFSIEPDIALVVEATTAADVAGVERAKQVCRLKSGAVLSFMDKGTIYDKELYSLAFEIAREKGIGCQAKAAVAGGNDAAAIHSSRGGVRTLALSVPCRYIHSPVSVMAREDLESARALLFELAKRLPALK